MSAEGLSTYHLYVVVALEGSIAVRAVMMILDLMVFAVFLVRPSFVADTILIGKMVPIIHVLPSCAL